MILIDSNIWIYYFDSSSKEHKTIAAFLEKILVKETVVVNTVIILEIAHYLIKNLGPIIGKKKMSTFFEYPLIIVDLDYELTIDAINLFSEHSHSGIGGRDASILATLKRKRIFKLITHDNAFKQIDWINVIDPISRYAEKP